MRLRLGTFSRYRPRVLTLVLFIVIAALIVLANLAQDPISSEKVAYGWPLIWHWHTIVVAPPAVYVRGWEHNDAALCGNAALWLLILAAGCGACEWLLRRRPPRFRWSLKTMLVAIGVIAAICGWFVAARNRARVQDEVLRLAEKNGGTVYFERLGPRWLDLVGIDRFRRRIIGVKYEFYNIQDERYAHDVDDDLEDFERLTRLLDLRQLRFLNIRFEYGHESGQLEEEVRAVNGILAIVGNLTQLEELRLEGPTILSDRLGGLARLTNLRFLSLAIHDYELDERRGGRRPSLSHLPVLPQLEALNLGGLVVTKSDFHQLAALPRLRSLALDVDDADPAGLARLNSLEELEIRDTLASPAIFESLGSLKRLKALHIGATGYYSLQQGELVLDGGDILTVNEKDVAKLSRALRASRQSCPGITVDANQYVLDTRYSHWDALPDRGVPAYLRQQMTFPILPHRTGSRSSDNSK